MQSLFASTLLKLCDISFLLVLMLGNLDGYTKSDEGKMMSALSLGKSETVYAHSEPDCSQPFVSVFTWHKSW